MAEERAGPSRLRFPCGSLEEFLDRYGVDLERGGIFLRLRRPGRLDVLLRFELQLFENAPLLAGDGTLLSGGAAPNPGGVSGVRLRFDRLDPESAPFLDRLLD